MAEELPRGVSARRGFSVEYRGRAILSRIDPITQSERIAQSAPVLPKTLYLCYSPLYGYGLRTLLSRMAPDSGILCLEADEKLMEFTLQEFPAELKADGRIRIARTVDGAAACAFLRKEFGSRRFRRVVGLKMSGGCAFYPEVYESIETAVRADIGIDWSNAMTLVRLGRRYALNAVRNLGLLPVSASLESLSFGSDPVLVLGAGPSLDAAESLLKAERKYRIVCVDTAILPLLHRGIRPDLVVVLEAQHWNLRDFIGAEGRSIPVALDLSSLPASSVILGGERYLFSVPWTPLRFFQRLRDAGLQPPPIPPMGSVGLAAVSVALEAGSGPVVVAGLDFAYGIGTYHARSAPSRLDKLMKADRTHSIIDPAPAFRQGALKMHGKGRREFRTDPALRSYRDLFERDFGNSDRLFDAGKEGLDLGIRKISEEEAIGLLNRDERSEGNGETREFSTIASPQETIDFIDGETTRLEKLKALLSGTENHGNPRDLIVDCDYLWSHFPEYAGVDDAVPDITNISVLKRIRAEIDPFQKAFSLAKAEIGRN